MRTRIILAVIILALLGSAGYVLRQGYLKNAAARYIEISGTIETTEVDVSFQIPGKIKQLLTDEGAKVQPGDLLAVLDTEDLLKQRQAAQASLEGAQSQLPLLKTRIALSQAQAQGTIAQAGAALQESQIRLQQYKSGLRPQEKAQAYKELDAAHSNFEFMTRELKRAERLYKEGALPGQQRDTIVNNYKIAEARYKQAQEKLSLALEGNRVEDVQAAAARVAQSRANLAMAQAAPLETQALLRQEKTYGAQVRQAQANLAYLNTQLQHARLYAPIAGVVLVKAKEIGEVVSPGIPVVTLGELDKVWLKAYIGETDLGRVKLGQQVAVVTDSYPGKRYAGKVYYISSEAEFTPKNLQTKEDRVKLVYRIKVALDNAAQDLKPGMIADGKIDLTSEGR